MTRVAYSAAKGLAPTLPSGTPFNEDPNPFDATVTGADAIEVVDEFPDLLGGEMILVPN